MSNLGNDKNSSAIFEKKKKKKREREKRRIKVAGKMLSPILDMFEVIPDYIRENFRTVLDLEL